MRQLLPASVVLTLSVAPSLALASGTCPAAIVHVDTYSGSGPFSTDALAYDSTFAVLGEPRISFNRRLGAMALAARSGGRMIASVRVIERIDVSGVPNGTRVDGTIEFHLDGWSEQNCGGAGCGLIFEGSLTVATDSVQANADHDGPTLGTRTLASTLRLPVHFVAGTPIVVEFFMRYATGPGQTGAHAEGTGRYAVSGLPAGVRAVTCSDAALTPVPTATWGRLKRAYR